MQTSIPLILGFLVVVIIKVEVATSVVVVVVVVVVVAAVVEARSNVKCGKQLERFYVGEDGFTIASYMLIN